MISYHNGYDTAFTIDQHADLPVGLKRQITQVSSQFRCDNLLSRNFAAINMLNSPHLVRFQTCHITVNALNLSSSYAKNVVERDFKSILSQIELSRPPSYCIILCHLTHVRHARCSAC